MEDNFYKDDFEHFLRSSTDNFLMVPSRKVWYSIYNDMHPDRKWPSLAVCLIILSAVLFIGISNNNSLGDAARKESAANMNSLAKNYAANLKKNTLDPAVLLSAIVYRANNPKTFSLMKNTDEATIEEDLIQFADNDGLNKPEDIAFANESAAGQENISPEKDRAAAENTKLFATASMRAAISNAVSSSSGRKSAGKNAAADNDVVTADSDNALKVTGSGETALAANEQQAAQKNHDKLKITETEQRTFIEDFAFHNKPSDNKFKKNGTISFYFTPSVAYRTLSRRDGYMPAGSLLLASRNSRPLSKALMDNISVSLEAGAGINYSISKRVRLKGGLQFNYTNYITRGTALGHPVQAAVAVTDGALMLRSTDLSTEGDRVNINHSTIDISIPLGADFKIAGRKNVKWYAGATVQPTYVFGGNALVLSADEKNFVSEKSLRRNWNLNVAAETFVSIKMFSGVILNAGPQIRYQTLSTFKKPYAYKENLFSTGIKIGLTKNF